MGLVYFNNLIRTYADAHLSRDQNTWVPYNNMVPYTTGEVRAARPSGEVMNPRDQSGRTKGYYHFILFRISLGPVGR